MGHLPWIEIDGFHWFRLVLCPIYQGNPSICAQGPVLWMDENLHHLKKALELFDSPVNTNKPGFHHGFSGGANWISSVHTRTTKGFSRAPADLDPGIAVGRWLGRDLVPGPAGGESQSFQYMEMVLGPFWGCLP